MIYPFSGNHSQKFYWGSKEILIPVFQQMAEAMALHPEVDVLINFASFRSAYDSTMAALEFPQVQLGQASGLKSRGKHLDSPFANTGPWSRSR